MGFFSKYYKMAEQDTNDLEKKELEALVEKGVRWKCKKASILRFIGDKEREFTIKPLSLGLIFMLSSEFKKITFDPNKLQENWLSESKKLMETAPMPLARIVMISVLRNKTTIRFFGNWVANYFMNRVEPKQLLDLALAINQMCNPQDFILSIKYLSVHATIIKPPHLVENTVQEADEEVIL